MADKEIGSLTVAGALAGTELAHIIQSGNSRQVTLQDIADLAVIEIEDEGSLVGGGQFLRLNFVGVSVTVTDAGSGEATVTINPPLNRRTVNSSGNFIAADFSGGGLIIVDSASDIILTLPTGLNPTQACSIFRKGTGEVDIAASGTTILSEAGDLSINAQYNAASLFPTGTSEEYALVGKLKA